MSIEFERSLSVTKSGFRLDASYAQARQIFRSSPAKRPLSMTLSRKNSRLFAPEVSGKAGWEPPRRAAPRNERVA